VTDPLAQNPALAAQVLVRREGAVVQDRRDLFEGEAEFAVEQDLLQSRPIAS
jgi:hypothetical protein